jgi:DNA-binding XRE family transcriptional regulator
MTFIIIFRRHSCKEKNAFYFLQFTPEWSIFFIVAKEAKIMFLPRRLKQAREKAGLSQEKFVVMLSKSGLSLGRNALSSWEKGKTKPNVDELIKLSECLRMPLGYFFTRKTLQNGLEGTNGASA